MFGKGVGREVLLFETVVDLSIALDDGSTGGGAETRTVMHLPISLRQEESLRPLPDSSGWGAAAHVLSRLTIPSD